MLKKVSFIFSLSLLFLVSIFFSVSSGTMIRIIVDYSEVVVDVVFCLLFNFICITLLIHPKRGEFGHLMFTGSLLLLNVFGYGVIFDIFYILNNLWIPWLSTLFKVSGILMLISSVLMLNKSYTKSMDKLRKTNSSLETSVYVDSMTGLFNRKYLDELLDSAEFNLIRSDYCLIIVDIDKFKDVNDEYGHSTGDEIIKLCSSAIALSIRDDSYGFRYGGEEFLIIAKGTKSECQILASRISENFIQSTTDFGVLKGCKTLSCGIDNFTKESDFGIVFENADSALYEAKNSGRNKIIVHK